MTSIGPLVDKLLKGSFGSLVDDEGNGKDHKATTL